jgi:hypothetical protein
MLHSIRGFFFIGGIKMKNFRPSKNKIEGVVIKKKGVNNDIFRLLAQGKECSEKMKEDYQ